MADESLTALALRTRYLAQELELLSVEDPSPSQLAELESVRKWLDEHPASGNGDFPTVTAKRP